MVILSRLIRRTSSEVDETLGPNLAFMPVDEDDVDVEGVVGTAFSGGGGKENWTVELCVSLTVITSAVGSFRIKSEVDDTFSRAGGTTLAAPPSLTGVL